MSGLALAGLAFPVVRSVNVRQAKTQLSRLIDAPHASETILVATDGEPKRHLGVLKGQLLLPAPDDLFSSDGLSARYPRPALVVGRA
jgi:hypothetical protein